MKTNYHTHTYLCKHANGSPSDYVKKAIELGYDEIAITDHGPLIDEIIEKFYTRRMSFEEYHNQYLFDLQEAISLYGNQIKIITGLEIEYFEPMKNIYKEFLEKLDMLVLGQHYIYHNGAYKSVYATLTDDEIKTYGQMVTQALKTGLFKVFAHPEIFSYKRKHWDKVCDEVSREIIECCKENNVYLELNANGIRNAIERNKQWKTNTGETNYYYPRIEFFKLVKEAGLPVIINDDAHDPEQLSDDCTEAAIQMAKDIGLTVLDKIN